MDNLLVPAELSKIFDRSYTIDQSRRDGQTGLGLYIVKAIAEKQGRYSSNVRKRNILPRYLFSEIPINDKFYALDKNSWGHFSRRDCFCNKLSKEMVLLK